MLSSTEALVRWDPPARNADKVVVYRSVETLLQTPDPPARNADKGVVYRSADTGDRPQGLGSSGSVITVGDWNYGGLGVHCS